MLAHTFIQQATVRIMMGRTSSKSYTIFLLYTEILLQKIYALGCFCIESLS
jgi:hypothetical protein